MNIHKRFIHLALAGLYLAATINIAGANPVNINITGKVVASPCPLTPPNHISMLIWVMIFRPPPWHSLVTSQHSKSFI